MKVTCQGALRFGGIHRLDMRGQSYLQFIDGKTAVQHRGRAIMGSLLWSPRLQCQELELCLFPKKGLIQAFQTSLFEGEHGPFK